MQTALKMIKIVLTCSLVVLKVSLSFQRYFQTSTEGLVNDLKVVVRGV